MEGSDYLLTCAEVAVALAGFSALVVAVRQRGDDELAPLDRSLVSSLIERSLVAVFFSFLPILLHGLGISPARVWFVTSGGLSAYVVTLAWRGAVLRKREPQFSELISGPIFYIIWALGLFVLALQSAHALGLGVQQSVWWYLVGLTWLLVSVGYLFYLAIRGWARAA
ncbi:MAG: hypothetical protein DRP64_19290 [Verrucomicrobia bacterium]|nr:MAG: hypothetical protein DRP64_19290 [Verrucomicrobiota bacterium]